MFTCTDLDREQLKSFYRGIERLYILLFSAFGALQTANAIALKQPWKCKPPSCDAKRLSALATVLDPQPSQTGVIARWSYCAVALTWYQSAQDHASTDAITRGQDAKIGGFRQLYAYPPLDGPTETGRSSGAEVVNSA